MKRTITLLATLALTTLAHPLCPPCPSAVVVNRPNYDCGLGPGENPCASKGPCSPMAVRPLEVPRPPAPPLAPISSACSCNTVAVKPAVVPRPVCTAAVVNQQSNLNRQQQILYGSTDSLTLQQVLRQSPSLQAPADPVSLSIAYRLARESQRCNLDEDRLSYGFRAIPKDVPMYADKKKVLIPEGSLYTLKGQILELQAPKCSGPSRSLDEEALEDMLTSAIDREEADAGEQQLKKLSLGDLGYAKAKMAPATFVDVPLANPVEAYEQSLAASQAVGGSYHRDGFRPGEVVQVEVPNAESYDVPAPLPRPCADDEFEGGLPIGGVPAAAPPNRQGFANIFNVPLSYVAASSASSATSSQQTSQNVIFQKLGGSCGL